MVHRFCGSGLFLNVNRVFNYDQRFVMNERQSGLMSAGCGEVITPHDRPLQYCDTRTFKGVIDVVKFRAARIVQLFV